MRSPDPVTDEAEEASDRLLQKMAAAQSLEERESMGEGKRIGGMRERAMGPGVRRQRRPGGRRRAQVRRGPWGDGAEMRQRHARSGAPLLIELMYD